MIVAARHRPVASGIGRVSSGGGGDQYRISGKAGGFRVAFARVRLIRRTSNARQCAERAAGADTARGAAGGGAVDSRQRCARAVRQRLKRTGAFALGGARWLGDSTVPDERRFDFRDGEQERALHLRYASDGYVVDAQPVQVLQRDADTIRWSFAGRQLSANLVRSAETVHVFWHGGHYSLQVVDLLAHAGQQTEGHAGLAAPMPGKIIQLAVAAGETVEQGTALVVMEAMKMEHTLCAPARGLVRQYLCQVGDQVSAGAQLVEFERAG